MEETEHECFIYNGGVITMGKMYKIRQVFKCEGNFCSATTGYKVMYGTYLAAQLNKTNFLSHAGGLK